MKILLELRDFMLLQCKVVFSPDGKRVLIASEDGTANSASPTPQVTDACVRP